MGSIDKINQLTNNDFTSIFGNVFEKSVWISEKVYKLKPFNDLNELSLKFMHCFENETKINLLKILNLHPELAVEKIMTKDSQKEQMNAQLDQCSNEELLEFLKLNKDYKNKFSFPFIIAVANKDKFEILENFRSRIKNNQDIEYEEAKNQVKKIASIRLKKIYKDLFL
tara:strand:- start:876 stop:1382 length:507 start_codon:yes stop_codon:yes gene_type:complete